MSAYNPPSFNSPIFDSNAFTTGGQTIDTAYLQANYLKFPTAQGIEHLSTGSTATTPATTDNSTFIATTAFVKNVISSNTSTIKYTGNATFNTPTGCRFIDIQLIGYGGYAGVSDVGPPVFYGGAGSGGNMASITGFAITQNTSLTLAFVSTSGTGYVSIAYTGAGGLTNIAKVYNGNQGENGSQGSTAQGGTSNITASVINSRSASAFVYAGTAGLGSTIGGGGGSIPPATAGTGTSCPNGVFTYSNGLYGCGGTGNISAGVGVIIITYHCA